ncbi:hypothetical protein QZM35_37270 [Burkholderia sp. AU45274]|uniref:hypothetical protein n=1 Tax=Burkholderia sp. AU45274 TaxID=3059205 RepID=UPI00264EAEE8|nr:hypothetical protein [Burkholderia sp. AU45274]MDN7493385.1 hypothetical protein [Burkholderia sp. AU45274]
MVVIVIAPRAGIGMTLFLYGYKLDVNIIRVKIFQQAMARPWANWLIDSIAESIKSAIGMKAQIST